MEDRLFFGSGVLRSVLTCLFLSIPLVGCWSSDPRHPNILLIVVDTLRADRVGCYGAERETTPEIDEFAREAVRFERAYSTAPWTSPSIATMLTGLYPSTHGVTRMRVPLADSVPTLAEVLKNHGYATAAVVSHIVISRKWQFDQGFDLFDDSEAGGEEHVSTPGVTRLALNMLHRLVAQEQPFLLLVHYFDPHYTYQRHPEIGFAGPGAGRLLGGEPIQHLRRMLDSITDEEVTFLRDLYDEEVRFTDLGIGRLLEGLQEEGVYDSTVIVLASDHGEEFHEHGWIGHTRTLYEELVHIPLMVRLPRGANGGRVVRQPVSLVSLMPTLLDVVGVPEQGLPMQSRSIASLVESDERIEEEIIFFEVDFGPVQKSIVTSKTAHKKGIIVGRYKLVRDDRSGKLELFDLRDDPGEERNMADDRPSLIENLVEELELRIAFAKGEALPTREMALSPEEIEKLRGLGYVD